MTLLHSDRKRWPGRAPASLRHPVSRLRDRRAFTLIELMVVIAIVGLVLTIAVPSIYRQLHPDSMQKAVSDFMEACSQARAQAILGGTIAEVVITAEDHTISVRGAGPGARSSAKPLESPDLAGTDWRMSETRPAPASGGAGFTAKLSEKIAIELMEVNFVDQMELDEARIQFHPTGICDELKFVLFQPSSGERRLLTLDVVTGQLDVESDQMKFR